jgi:antitoxin component YwqK of YwqJK toxin-antitoxin module
MSGIQMTTEMSNERVTIDSIIEQIKNSQQNVFKAFEEHASFVNKSLELLRQMKTETKVEVVKVKDPLEEIKRLKNSTDYNMYGEDQFTNINKIAGFLTNIFYILTLYGTSKISASFKDMFLSIFKKCISDNDPININIIMHHFKNQLKKEFLKVRDIRWLLIEMEKYPQFFQFTEDDLELMKENSASRDNIYLIKKFLKKDGDYEEYYTEEEGGSIKCRYHMTGGSLNGEYKFYHSNGKIKEETSYKEGKQNNEWKVWYSNGNLFVDGKINGENKQWYETGELMNKYIRINDKKEGEYIEYHKNGNIMVKTSHKNDKVYGDIEFYFPNGQLHKKFYCLDGDIKLNLYKINGQYKEWNEKGNLIREIDYKNGKLDGLYKHWNDDGKELIEVSKYNNGEIDTKEGEYEEYYSEEEGGSIKYKYKLKRGILQGEYYEFYKNGQIKNIITYKNGLKDGNSYLFTNNGDKDIECEYKNGKLNGVYRTYSQNKLISEDNYIDDVLDGIHKGFDVLTGKLLECWYYSQGKINGFKELYHPCGDVYKYRCRYVKGKKEGEERTHNEKWQDITLYNYTNDILDGIYKEWYENGNIKDEGFYEKGKRKGVRKQWHSNGQLFSQCFYLNGDIIGLYKEWNEKGELVKECNYK